MTVILGSVVVGCVLGGYLLHGGFVGVLISLESHVGEPAKSPILSQSAFLLGHRHALDFMCDTLKLQLTGSVPAHDLAALLDVDLDIHRKTSGTISGLVQKLGDALADG